MVVKGDPNKPLGYTGGMMNSIQTSALFLLQAFAASSFAWAVDFQREIRPILAAKCFTCHGPDDAAREASLRLDTVEGSTADLGGYAAIVPKDRSQSELWKRIVSADPDLRMPPSDSHQALTDDQKRKLGEWIDAGAVYENHWAFVLPQSPIPVPDAKTTTTDSSATPDNGPIDKFIAGRLAKAGLTASPQADRFSLVRRLYLDLVGIPPTPEEADRFISDPSPMAYERLVDSLLASPDYAERWARPWLDLARYADTNGYEKDRPRTIWPYRDWVLCAIAEDMPFDEFSIRQLAGDMLPNASNDDAIATGFHRNTMLNEEGGIDPLEYRFHAMTDRVATTGLVWMGITSGCAQCHTHKYDPITHTDYYAMFALLNNADEPEMEVDAGFLAEQRQRIQSEIRKLEDEWIHANLTDAGNLTSQKDNKSPRELFRNWMADHAAAASAWQIIRPSEMESTMPSLSLLDDGSILASGDVTKRDAYTFRFQPNAGTPGDADTPGDAGTPAQVKQITALRLEAMPHESLPAEGPGMAYYEGRRGDFFLSEIVVTSSGKPVELRDASHSFGKLSVGSGSTDAANVIDGNGSTGWSTSGAEGKSNRLVVNLASPIPIDSPLEIKLVFERHFAAPLGRMRFAVADREDDAVALPLDSDLEAFLTSGKNLPMQERLRREQELQRLFLQTAPDMKQTYAAIVKRGGRAPEPVRTLVMRERSANPRPTHRHHRGEYLQAKEPVEPAIPVTFAPLTASQPTDRLEFAKWLVSDRNPMVGRVTVDRAWRELFGRGIVHTAGDYGTQSQPPSHPELLDYLAVDFIQQGWSNKRLHREIVLSAAYQRSNHRREDVMQDDPENELLAIGPRRRLEAERIRDSMLAVSGSLTRTFGGPSVYPPQPESVVALAYGKEPWPTSSGGDRYRRSVYTFAKRTAPFAAFTVFDGPTGETCLPRRDTSNSPLQSLTLMNDEMYIELAKNLVDDIVREDTIQSKEAIATEMFRRLLTRTPDGEELKFLIEFIESPAQQTSPGDTRAPWVLLARALMNVDEAISTP